MLAIRKAESLCCLGKHTQVSRAHRLQMLLIVAGVFRCLARHRKEIQCERTLRRGELPGHPDDGNLANVLVSLGIDTIPFTWGRYCPSLRNTHLVAERHRQPGAVRIPS